MIKKLKKKALEGKDGAKKVKKKLKSKSNPALPPPPPPPPAAPTVPPPPGPPTPMALQGKDFLTLTPAGSDIADAGGLSLWRALGLNFFLLAFSPKMTFDMLDRTFFDKHA